MNPNSIPFTSIVLGERGRSTYNGIEQLAESIRLNGLVQPIVLT
jgi:ParB-like chromosome segregation protein Spo0J